jgi:peptidoglycan L-alanyl-D-glutamate endopeptidase CwlK
MPTFSLESLSKLSTCDVRLQTVMRAVVAHFDCTIVEGHRGEERQNAMCDADPPKSYVRWPNGDHNTDPSRAVDAAPYPIDWEDRERATFFAGYVLGVARAQGVRLGWGGDWNHDWQVRDNNFDDLWHFWIRDE